MIVTHSIEGSEGRLDAWGELTATGDIRGELTATGDIRGKFTATGDIRGYIRG